MENSLEVSIKNQIGETPKNGIYEVFVNHQDYYSYYDLGTSPSPKMNQKMYAVVWDEEVEHLSLEKERAWSEFRSICKEEGVKIDF